MIKLFPANAIKFLPLNLFLIALFLGIPNELDAQRRDHLTAQEIELVQFFQEIDTRITVYSKAIERRFLSINGTDSLTKKELKRLKKDSEKWGELPKGSNPQLLSDIDKLLDEAITKLEDAFERNADKDLVTSAVFIMTDNAKIFIPRLENIGKKTKDSNEIAVIENAISQCKSIIEASTKLKRPSKKKRKKK